MMKKITTAYLILIAAALLTGCTERIDIDLDESYTRLIIDGSITNEAMCHCVKLSMTSSFLGGEPDPAVTGATVRIDNGRESFLLSENPSEPGNYYTDPSAQGQPGDTYTLSIQLANEINGKNEYTASCKMYPVAPLDSIGLLYREQWEAWEVQCYARDPVTEDYYMFDLYKNGIHLTDTLSEKFVVDDALYNGNYTNGIMVGFLDINKAGEVPHNGDTITLRIARITREQTYFIWDAQMESGYSNPLFGGPPANVVGNISDGAIGFFGAYAVAYASKVYKE